MAPRGFIVVPREVMKDPLLVHPVRRSIFLELVAAAEFKPTRTFHAGRYFELQRGQLIVVLMKLVKESVHCTRKEARGAIDVLRRAEWIDAEELQGHAGMLVTIRNYDAFQPSLPEQGQAPQEPAQPVRATTTKSKGQAPKSPVSGTKGQAGPPATTRDSKEISMPAPSEGQPIDPPTKGHPRGQAATQATYYNGTDIRPDTHAEGQPEGHQRAKLGPTYIENEESLSSFEILNKGGERASMRSGVETGSDPPPPAAPINSGSRLEEAIPRDWRPDEQLAAWGRGQGLSDKDLVEQTARFVDHLAGKPMFPAWSAGWRNWIRKELAYRERKGWKPPSGPDEAEETAASTRRMLLRGGALLAGAAARLDRLERDLGADRLDDLLKRIAPDVVGIESRSLFEAVERAAGAKLAAIAKS